MSDSPRTPTNPSIKRTVLLDGKEVAADRIEIRYDGLHVAGEAEPGRLCVSFEPNGMRLDVWGAKSASAEEVHFGSHFCPAEEVAEALCEEID
jgi:hypothetical protein